MVIISSTLPDRDGLGARGELLAQPEQGNEKEVSQRRGGWDGRRELANGGHHGRSSKSVLPQAERGGLRGERYQSETNSDLSTIQDAAVRVGRGRAQAM